MENKFIRSNIMMPLLLFFSHRDFYYKKEKIETTIKSMLIYLDFLIITTEINKIQ